MDKRNIPLCIPYIGQAEKEAVIEAIESGWMSHGPYNKKFEEDFAKYLGVEHAISMNSCASALEVSLIVNNIKGEVVIPSFTFVATANAVVNAGATPVFCDIDLKTRNVTAALIEEVLTPRTEAVIVVHFGGQPCPMDEISALCQKRNLLLIEDSAETLGATWDGKQAGSFGLGCFSFYPTKNITTGEGGMFTCSDDGMAARARTLIAHGVPSSAQEREKQALPWQRDAITAGHNFRMSNILAAIGYHQLQKVDEMNRMRAAVAEHYNQNLASLGSLVELPYVYPRATHGFQMYTILTSAEVRNDMVMYLRRQGIGASVHFDPPVHTQVYYRDKFDCASDLTNTEKLAASIITLPMYPAMQREDVDYVADVMQEFFRDRV